MSLLSVVTFLPQGLFIDNIAKHMEIGTVGGQQSISCSRPCAVVDFSLVFRQVGL